MKNFKRDYKNREKKRVNARDMINTYFKRGKVKKVFCENCGDKEQLEFHHPDYDKPFSVIILCKKCHLALHRLIKCALNRDKSGGN